MQIHNFPTLNIDVSSFCLILLKAIILVKGSKSHKLITKHSSLKIPTKKRSCIKAPILLNRINPLCAL